MNGIGLFVCHCDTISRIFDEGGTLSKNNYHIDLEKASVFSKYAQVFALWGDLSTEKDIEGRFAAQLALAKNLLNGQNGAPVLCKNARDMDAALSKGRPAAFLAAEGAELLGCSEETLECARSEGLRFVTLTWNNLNLCASSAAADENGGLTPHGRSFVKKAEEQGVVLDVSHLSERGFFDLAECTDRPFIASHSNARAVWDHRRNLRDEQLRF
jgi:membrane dipeptidase